MPSRFARQFGYDHLDVGNSTTGLRFRGNLFEDARAWYYSAAGGTEAIFSLLYKTPNCYTNLNFCTWYFIASRVPDFGMNSSCIKSSKASYKVKLVSKSHMREMSEHMEAKREAEREARKEISRQRQLQGWSLEQKLQRNNTLGGSASCAQASSSLCFPR